MMVFTMRRMSWLIAIQTLLLSIHGVEAFKLLSSSSSKGSQVTAPNASDLQALLHYDSIIHNNVYTQAIEILSSMQSAPTCNRLATSKLLNSCQAIDGADKAAEQQMEDLKSMYAAQLAICELSDADSPVPHSCKGLAVIPGIKSTDHLRKIRKSKISECLKALESRPQSWTSYSNSKQNAVMLCRATRIDIEKDEIIKLHQSMVQTQSSTSKALDEATKVSQESLARLRASFEELNHGFRDELVRELEKSTLNLNFIFNNIAKRLSSAFDAALDKVRSSSAALESQLASLNENLRSAFLASSSLEQNVGKVFQKVVEGSSELANVQTAQWETSRGAATELQTSLQSIQDGNLASLVRSLQDMGVRLDTSNQLIVRMYERQSDIERQMNGLGRSFSHLESKADAIGAAQMRQGETQERLSQQMEVDMQVAQGFLADVASSAAELQATVSETSSKVQTLAAFTKFLSTMVNGLLLLGLLIVLLVAVAVIAIGWQYSQKVFFYVVAAIAVVLLMLYTGSIISGSVRLDIAQHVYDNVFLRAAFALGGLLGAFCICYQMYVGRRTSYERFDCFNDSAFKRAKSHFAFK